MRRILQRQRQRGVALITALLIVALATTAAAWLTNSHQLSIRRSGNLINGDQAYEYALGLEMMAIMMLNEDFKDQNNKTDGFSDLWAIEIPPFPVEGGVVTGKVTDLQGLFNLNNLLDKSGKQDTVGYPRFQRLLQYFEMEPTLADAALDWIDADVNARGTVGAEDDFYAGLEKPYRPANMPFTSVSELRMVRGFNVEQFDLLSKVLTALPVGTSINVNTAPMEVHFAIGVPPDLAEMLDQNPDKELDETENGTNSTLQNNNTQRMISEFESVDDYANQGARGTLSPDQKKNLSVKSSYFLFEGEARIDRGYCLLKSILYRDNSGNIRVLMRTQGTL